MNNLENIKQIDKSFYQPNSINISEFNENIVNTIDNVENINIINDVFNNGFNVLFIYALGLLSILFSIYIITSKNPIISVLYLIMLFFCISMYLILMGLNFIGISYLLVYIGAVSMLFLFILMLIDIRLSELHINSTNSLVLSIIISIVFILILDTNIINDLILMDINYINIVNWDNVLTEYYDIINIGNLLYTNYSIWLIITSLILLLAMVGAIIINIQ
jgi:NADH-ubiquinone oxidoreductase chain 6